MITGPSSSPMQTIDRWKLIAQGSFGTVFHGHRVLRVGSVYTDSDIAVKIISKSAVAAFNGHSRKRRRDVLASNESDILSRLKHRHIVHMYCSMENATHCCVMMERVLYGDVLQCLTQDKTSFSNMQAASIMRQCASALAYIHGHHVVHRDVKPNNLLIKRYEMPDKMTMEVQLSDFGFARFASSPIACKTLIGSREYLAPEIIYTSQEYWNGYGAKSDVWSAGVCLYLLATGTMPFLEHKFLYQQICSGKELRFDSVGYLPFVELEHDLDEQRPAWAEDWQNRPLKDQMPVEDGLRTIICFALLRSPMRRFNAETLTGELNKYLTRVSDTISS